MLKSQSECEIKLLQDVDISKFNQGSDSTVFGQYFTLMESIIWRIMILVTLVSTERLSSQIL